MFLREPTPSAKSAPCSRARDSRQAHAAPSSSFAPPPWRLGAVRARRRRPLGVAAAAPPSSSLRRRRARAGLLARVVVEVLRWARVFTCLSLPLVCGRPPPCAVLRRRCANHPVARRARARQSVVLASASPHHLRHTLEQCHVGACSGDTLQLLDTRRPHNQHHFVTTSVTLQPPPSVATRGL